MGHRAAAILNLLPLLPWRCRLCGRLRWHCVALELHEHRVCLTCARKVTRRINRYAFWLNDPHRAARKEQQVFRDRTGPAIESLRRPNMRDVFRALWGSQRGAGEDSGFIEGDREGKDKTR